MISSTDLFIMNQTQAIKTTLIGLSMLTVMSGAAIAPALPQMADVFSKIPNAEFLTKLVLTAPAIFIAIFSPIFGYLADRISKRTILLVTLTLYGITGTSGIYLNDLYMILAGRAILGIAIAGIMTVTTTTIATYFEGEDLNDMLGLRSAGNAFGGVIFLILSGLLADINWHAPFYVYILAFLALPPVYFLLRQRSKQSETNAKIRDNEKIPWKIVSMLYLISFISMLAYYMMPIEIPFLIEDKMQMSSVRTGVAIGVSFLFAAIAALSFKRLARYLHHVRIYFMTFILITIGYGIISIASGYATVMIGLIVAGFGLGLVMPNTIVLLTNVTPFSLRGRVIGGFGSVLFIGQAITPVIYHPLTEHYGISKTFGIGAGCLLVISLIFLMLDLHSRKRAD